MLQIAVATYPLTKHYKEMKLFSVVVSFQNIRYV